MVFITGKDPKNKNLAPSINRLVLWICPILGIKHPWTLADENNWNKTHRMAGPLWSVCGFLIFPVILSMMLVTCIYSWLLYRNSTKVH